MRNYNQNANDLAIVFGVILLFIASFCLGFVFTTLSCTP